MTLPTSRHEAIVSCCQASPPSLDPDGARSGSPTLLLHGVLSPTRTAATVPPPALALREPRPAGGRRRISRSRPPHWRAYCRWLGRGLPHGLTRHKCSRTLAPGPRSTWRHSGRDSLATYRPRSGSWTSSLGRVVAVLQHAQRLQFQAAERLQEILDAETLVGEDGDQRRLLAPAKMKRAEDLRFLPRGMVEPMVRPAVDRT